MFSNYKGIILEINKRNKLGKCTNMWKLNKTHQITNRWKINYVRNCKTCWRVKMKIKHIKTFGVNVKQLFRGKYVAVKPIFNKWNISNQCPNIPHLKIRIEDQIKQKKIKNKG